MQLTTHLHPAHRLRMCGAIPLLPLYDSWRGQGQLCIFNTSLSVTISQRLTPAFHPCGEQSGSGTYSPAFHPCGEQSGTGTYFTTNTLSYPVHYHSTKASYAFTSHATDAEWFHHSPQFQETRSHSATTKHTKNNHDSLTAI